MTRDNLSKIRQASFNRDTTETSLAVTLKIEGNGIFDIKTGIGFFDHMLEQFSRHSLIDMQIRARGDLHVDDHHTVEDCGIALGKALLQSLQDRVGITRYASLDLVMDECSTRAAIDVSGRSFLSWHVPFSSTKIGTFDTELVREFFQAFVQNSGITLHVTNNYGINNHHIVETCFKAVARVLRNALEIDYRQKDKIPSTKGLLG